MSQLPRRGSDESSPTSVKQPFINGLIPRDYLARSDRSMPAPGRHITPSPLHTSSLPQSHPTDASTPSHSPLSPGSSANPSPAKTQSPIARVAHATFPAPPLRHWS
ncbi:hypothetical protein N7541_008236 [Penicillium brevicompactum]|uniref:Uncharacterized protein n=1 Tax=Penicillium brevicompactum TaxID=5074 RepID=A0A9W9R1P3_PENBR|nr:hypothetical protein N7541_008236 [Penicillium brevicompactum]